MPVNVYYQNHERELVSLTEMEHHELYEVDDPHRDWHGSIVCTDGMLKSAGQVFIIYGKTCKSLQVTYASGTDRKVFRPVQGEVTVRRK